MHIVQHHLRRLGLLAVLLPFILTSLIGAGVMPVRSDSGVLMLVICTGDEMVEVAFDPVTMTPVADDADNRGSPAPGPCDWATAQHAFALSFSPTFSSPIRLLVASLVPQPAVVLVVAAATSLPPATGPPHLL